MTAELKGLASELRQARGVAPTSYNGSQRQWRMNVRVARVVWILYSLIADPSAVLLHYLRGVRGYDDVREWGDEALLELSDRSFLEAEFHDLVAVVDEENPSDERAMRVAKRLLAEWRMFRWCEEQNVTNRIAPSTAALLSRARIDGTVFPVSAFGLNSSGRPAPAAREWARRWRERWGARIGVVQACEQLSVDEMRLKVRCLILFPLGRATCNRWRACWAAASSLRPSFFCFWDGCGAVDRIASRPLGCFCRVNNLSCVPAGFLIVAIVELRRGSSAARQAYFEDKPRRDIDLFTPARSSWHTLRVEESCKRVVAQCAAGAPQMLLVVCGDHL